MSTPSEFTLRRVGPADATAVIAVLDAARSRSVAAGYDMWPLGFTADRLEPALGAGRTFLAVDGAGSALGTITVERADPLWADRADGTAGYVHRLAARDRGTGLGARLLDWADRHVAGFGGDRLRLDCIAWDAPLRRYYERAGFVHVDDVALPPLPGVPPPTRGPVALARYERLVVDRGGDVAGGDLWIGDRARRAAGFVIAERVGAPPVPCGRPETAITAPVAGGPGLGAGLGGLLGS